jgi:hypothetical protein
MHDGHAAAAEAIADDVASRESYRAGWLVATVGVGAVGHVACLPNREVETNRGQ